MFTLEIETENAAFEDDRTSSAREEISRILRVASEQLLCGAGGGFLRDINGNRVGKWRWE
jgi:hypothetical protein